MGVGRGTSNTRRGEQIQLVACTRIHSPGHVRRVHPATLKCLQLLESKPRGRSRLFGRCQKLRIAEDEGENEGEDDADGKLHFSLFLVGHPPTFLFKSSQGYVVSFLTRQIQKRGRHSASFGAAPRWRERSGGQNSAQPAPLESPAGASSSTSARDGRRGADWPVECRDHRSRRFYVCCIPLSLPQSPPPLSHYLTRPIFLTYTLR